MTLLQPALMVDIETMGKRPTSAFTSIGAVLFDPHGDWIGDTFHIHVSLENCMRHGLKVDADTIIWWMHQDEAARNTFIFGQVDAAPLITALEAFSAFAQQACHIWCNGNSFDFPILNNAYDVVGMQTPWHFWHEHDLRTLKNLNKGTRIEREGIHHNALDDAVHQAKLVQRILQTNPDMDA